MSGCAAPTSCVLLVRDPSPSRNPSSKQALREPAFLDTAAEWAARVGEICAAARPLPPIAAAAAAAPAPPPPAVIWLGETGSAQVGGDPVRVGSGLGQG